MKKTTRVLAAILFVISLAGCTHKQKVQVYGFFGLTAQTWMPWPETRIDIPVNGTVKE